MAQNALIKIRRDVAADWTSTNPTLAEGEIGWEIDTNLAKIGDGATAWTGLDYFADHTAAGYLEPSDIGVTVQGYDSDLAAISALTTTGYGRSVLELANAAASRALFGVVIGTDVQAYDADLAAIAALATTSFGRSLLTQADFEALRAVGIHVPTAPITQSGTSYTAVLSDAQGYIQFTNAAAIAFTIPPNASVAFPIGTTITIEQNNSGVVTFTAGAGVTLRSRGSFVATAGQYAVAQTKKVATDTWTIIGDVA